uniref:Uncharacterized protein n=1 Tax=Magnetococcus massalia (strain MO-1) TaxID=451514 RepID=A0A1S7LHQ9_MAGMO|nr:Conserved membrane protein of unknown function [Candidatus Magnetococcus massalia]
MLFNAEFRRYLWVELNLHRVVVMPLVLAGLFYLTWITRSYETLWNPRNFLLTSFMILTLIWGVRQAGDTVIQEVLQRTWDTQRMSILSPWSMTWGKLFGSTIFTWYGALLTLVALYLVIINHYPFFPEDRLWQLMLFAVGCGLLAQALSMMFSMLNIVNGTMEQRRHFSTPLIIGLLFSFFFFIGVEHLFHTPLDQEPIIQWYDYFVPLTPFALISMGALLLWSWLGVYRLMSMELQKHKGPLMWLLFLIFLCGYAAGFVPVTRSMAAEDQQLLKLGSALLIITAMTYLAAFFESKDLLAYRKTLFHARRGDLIALFRALPLWWVGLCLVVAVQITILFTPFRADFIQATVSHDLTAPLHIKWALVAALFFAIRDLALMQLLYLNPKAKRAKLTILLYLTLFYVLLPEVAKAVGLESLLASLFYPVATKDPLIIVSPAVVEALVVISLAWSRWKGLMRAA